MAKKKENSQAEPVEAGEKIEVKSAPQVNDVAKPGSTAASPTSRPIITNHSNMIKQDPMVSGSSRDKDLPKDKEQKEVKKSEVKLEPIAAEDKPEASEEPKNKIEPESSEPLEDKPEPPKKTEENSNSDSAAIDTLADAAESKKLSSKETEADKAKEEKIKELIASKKYNVSIVEGGHKATSQRLASWLLLLLLLSAAGAYLAIDAGYLDVGVDLPFDLIKD